MIKPGSILGTSVAATTVMTLFSQLVSEAEHDQFNEAELLDDLLHNLHPAINKNVSNAAGWTAHYAIGLTFTLLYAVYLKQTNTKPTIGNGLAFGAIGGAIGIAGWSAMLKAHPRLPRINTKLFFPQLMIAHLVFGAVAGSLLPKAPGSKSR